ncbi:hypothetical protein Tco_1205824, partial [Tanacetum coccineum]
MIAIIYCRHLQHDHYDEVEKEASSVVIAGARVLGSAATAFQSSLHHEDHEQETEEEEPKPLDSPMQTEEEDLIPLDVLMGINTRGQVHYGLRSLRHIQEEVVVVKKPYNLVKVTNVVLGLRAPKAEVGCSGSGKGGRPSLMILDEEDYDFNLRVKPSDDPMQ